jgi:(p)ppGpp synthase/HD superfamily hydrolase
MSEEVCLLARAVAFAAREHRRHRRKDVERTPYINHLAHVAQLLAEAGCDANVIAAGYLHDCIEDVDVSYGQLASAFGKDIADLVLAVTDDKNLRWMDRKRMQVEHAPLADPRVAALKLADKISNLYSLRDAPPHGWSREKISAYIEWAHQVVSRLPEPNAVLLAEYEEIRAELLRKFGGSQWESNPP